MRLTPPKTLRLLWLILTLNTPLSMNIWTSLSDFSNLKNTCALILLCKVPNKTNDIVFLFFFYSRKIPSFFCLILQKPFILMYLLLTQKNNNTVISSQKYWFQMFTSFLDEYMSWLFSAWCWGSLKTALLMEFHERGTLIKQIK